LWLNLSISELDRRRLRLETSGPRLPVLETLAIPDNLSGMNSAQPNFLLDVALLPTAIKPEMLAGHDVVVVDVLRATTTIINALHNGCKEVLPQPGIEQARSCFEAMTEPAIIGGERNGQIVEGFHNGNSPEEYTAQVIADKSLILATTNGTVAMESCRAADRVLIGSMVNVSAVASAMVESSKVTVVCSGTDRLITSEDILFAGKFVQRLLELRGEKELGPTKLTDPATIALHHWQTVEKEVAVGRPLVEFFQDCRGGINLVRIGHQDDVDFASQIDIRENVPELNLESWTIR